MKYVHYLVLWGLAIVLLLSSTVWFIGCYSMRGNVNLTTVDNFDLTRYIGQWYEIARFDHWFERGMSHTKATYAMLVDGGISVVNTGVKDGKLEVAAGKGKPTRRQGHLRVSFVWPFYGDYRVLWIDENYQHALVGGDDSRYLWILARTPTIDRSVKGVILSEAVRRGYDVDKLIWVEQ